MLHHDVSHYQRHAKPAASWDHIALNQAHFYEQEVVTLDSSRDSVIEINQVHEQGPLDDAPPAPADPPSTPENPNEKVTYGAQDIRYKNKTTKRVDRTPSTSSSTSSSDAPWTPSYTRGRGRSPFVRGGGRGRTSPNPTSSTFRTPSSVTRSNPRNAFDKSQASTKEKQRNKDAENHSSGSPSPSEKSRKRKKKTKKNLLPKRTSKVR